MEHPIPTGTSVVAAYKSCETCGPSHIEKIGTRIREYRQEDDGTFVYTLLDGREVSQADIIEVK